MKINGSIMHLGNVRKRGSELLPMQEGPGAVTLTIKQLSSSIIDEKTDQKQGVKRLSKNLCL